MLVKVVQHRNLISRKQFNKFSHLQIEEYYRLYVPFDFFSILFFIFHFSCFSATCSYVLCIFIGLICISVNIINVLKWFKHLQNILKTYLNPILWFSKRF